MQQNIPANVLEVITRAQATELTESVVYSNLAKKEKNPENKKVFRQIAEDEARHYALWKQYSGIELQPNYFQVLKYGLISGLLGITFGIKLMEKGEQRAQINYAVLAKHVPDAKKIALEEEAHEKKLIAMINEERLEYVGSIVLGLNDALVELTGALAGFTFVLQNTALIGAVGLVTGIAASFSMAASEYLSSKTDGNKNAKKSALYTGIAYILTVILLVLPFFVLQNVFVALAVCLSLAILVILFFTFYISVAKELDFKQRFFEMAGISLGVALLSFFIGFVVKTFFGIEV